MNTQETKDVIEKIIDSNSLSRVLEMISQVCYEKSHHIKENWQDKDTAFPWEEAGRHLSRLSDKVAC